jgi:hypothetical protein
MNAAVQKNPMRTLILRMLGGAVAGGVAITAFLAVVGDRLADLDDKATVVAIAAGATYIVIGLSVALGLVAPKAGATYLNVEDAEELREQGGMLALSAVACILTGAFLLILALAEAITPGLALPLAAACIIGIAVSGWMVARRQDELTKQIGLESSTLTLQVVMILVGGWAALAVLGYADWLGPLAFIATVLLVQLFAIFVVITKRGMMMPR